MMLIQIILEIFFLFAILKVLGRYRAGEVSGKGAALWIIFWVLAGVLVFQPNATFYFARLVGIGRGADLVTYISLAIIFFVLFRITVKMEKINREITKLTRKIALKEGEQNNKNV